MVYHERAYDVVGAMVGVVEKEKMITGENIQAGDVLIALPSNGLHTNGYSLARKVFPDLKKVGEKLLKPHTSYVHTVLNLHANVGLKGVAHITGGGIPGNLPRILPKGLGAKIEKTAINVPPIFTLIQEKGDVSEEEMFQTFNMGVGMILVVAKEDVDIVLKKADGSYVMGEIVEGADVKIV